MNIRNRLSKLEDAASGFNKPLMEMSTEELEQFLRKELELPAGTPITDDMLWEVSCRDGVRFSRYTHEERLDMLLAEEGKKA